MVTRRNNWWRRLTGDIQQEWTVRRFLTFFLSEKMKEDLRDSDICGCSEVGITGYDLDTPRTLLTDLSLQLFNVRFRVRADLTRPTLSAGPAISAIHCQVWQEVGMPLMRARARVGVRATRRWSTVEGDHTKVPLLLRWSIKLTYTEMKYSPRKYAKSCVSWTILKGNTYSYL